MPKTDFVRRQSERPARRCDKDMATRLAELLGDDGAKLIKPLLGYSDGSVSAIYTATAT